MQESRQVNYFRIGTFVITGIVLIIVAVFVFGSGMLFKRVIYVETYFNESVQGLTVGSPVKYLGMDIGHVKEISTADSIYQKNHGIEDASHHRYIYVLMVISQRFFVSHRKDEISQELQRDIANGLKIKLALQGLTGTAYLELDFMPQDGHQPLQIAWTPKHYYIPSTVSTLTYFSDNVQSLLRKLRKMNLDKLVNTAQDFFATADKASHELNGLLAHTNNQVVGTLNNLQTITENFNSLSEQAKSFPSSVIFGKAPPKLDPSKL